MVNTKLNLSLNEPYVRTVYAKEGDSGRVFNLDIDPTPTENGTLRIKRPDGVEVTSSASSGGEDVGTSFTTIADGQFTKLEMGIEPIQDLSNGDPSPTNICPIYPFVGKNWLVNTAWVEGQYSSGVWYDNNNSRKTSDYSLIMPNKQFTISIDPDHDQDLAFINYNYFDANKTWLGDRTTNGDASFSGQRTFTTAIHDSKAYYIRLTCRGYSDGNANISAKDPRDAKPMLELGSTATPYVPYNTVTVYVSPTESAEDGVAYPTTLPQLVYGGTLDVVSGKLTVTQSIITIDGANVDHILHEDNGIWRIYTVNSLPDQDRMTIAYDPIICNRYKGLTSYNGVAKNNSSIAVNYRSMSQFIIRDDTFVDLADIRAKFNAEPLVICYPRLNPTEVDLTPTQISTLLGENNIFADCGDVVEVSFAYDGMYAELPSSATSVVGRCIGDVELNGVSTMPFTLVVQKNNQGVNP